MRIYKNEAGQRNRRKMMINSTIHAASSAGSSSSRLLGVAIVYSFFFVFSSHTVSRLLSPVSSGTAETYRVAHKK